MYLQIQLEVRTLLWLWTTLTNAVTDDANTAIGYRALESNTGGQYNVAVGSRTLEDTTTGDYNNVWVTMHYITIQLEMITLL